MREQGEKLFQQSLSHNAQNGAGGEERERKRGIIMRGASLNAERNKSFKIHGRENSIHQN